mmetsp:Transcript_72563/g.142323  ORF Transcript_72563/g.142323 Transcript_72563/m.142323 type:complete len:82 (-) Transcript_72563:171-416(-)
MNTTGCDGEEGTGGLVSGSSTEGTAGEGILSSATIICGQQGTTPPMQGQQPGDTAGDGGGAMLLDGNIETCESCGGATLSA